MSKQKMSFIDHNGDQLFIARVTNKAFIFDPETKKFLFARAADMKEEYWKLIGGRMRAGEELEAALHREIAEEIGKDVQYETMGVIGVTTVFEQGEAINIVAHLVLYQGGEIVLDEEHSEYRWFTFEEAMGSKCIARWAPPLLEESMKRMKEKEYLTDLKRLQADFENYKKRQQESQKELGGYLIEKLVLDIIPVLDNFRAATMHVPEEQKSSPWVTGIQYIEKQLEDVVKQNGVEVIEAKAGDTFDPSIHEAVSSEGAGGPEPVEGAEESNGHSIAKVLQNGFRLGGKVIRPAKVTVK